MESWNNCANYDWFSVSREESSILGRVSRDNPVFLTPSCVFQNVFDNSRVAGVDVL